jgi:hypothetical protein
MEEKKLVSNEEAKELVKEILKNDPVVLKELKMRPNEQDIRELRRKDKDQLSFRLMTDYWQYLSAINTTLVAIQIVAMEIAKKMGIPIENLLDEYTKVDDK